MAKRKAPKGGLYWIIFGALLTLLFGPMVLMAVLLVATAKALYKTE